VTQLASNEDVADTIHRHAGRTIEQVSGAIAREVDDLGDGPSGADLEDVVAIETGHIRVAGVAHSHSGR